MKRQHPFFSSFGFIFTALLIAGLGLALWRTGGMAFNPGLLSARSHSGEKLKGFTTHAEFETQCRLCHAPLKTTQDVLCLECHSRIAEDIQEQVGAHGMIKGINRCFSCHSEHQGRDFDATRAASTRFDHITTGFSLAWHQVNFDTTPMDCAACHNLETHYSVEIEKCATCHGENDQTFMVRHLQDFGENCLACHDGKDFMVQFDHAKTAFPLEGKHTGLRCVRCHEGVAKALSAKLVSGGTSSTEVAYGEGVESNASLGQMGAFVRDQFRDTPKECIHCHAEPDVHRGLFEQNCAACHTSSGWTPAVWDGKPFDHAKTTNFSLVKHAKDYSGQTLTCMGCHQEDIRSFNIQTCVDCHRDDQRKPGFGKTSFAIEKHLQDFGENCLDCHDGVDRMSNFDHMRFFVLDGAHAELKCEKCHAEKVFKGTPSQCSACHAEPKIHAGSFGLQCQDCHTTKAWLPAQLRVHKFPLDHGRQGEMPTSGTTCKVCHVTTYVEYTCYGCHDHQPDQIREGHLVVGVSIEDLPNCTKCHPTGLKQVK